MGKIKKTKKETLCRSCKKGKLVSILDLGSMPPANAFLNKNNLRNKEKLFPLRVAVCPHCMLVQLQDMVDPCALFSRDYYYFTGASGPLTKHFEDFGKRLVKDFSLTKNDLVVEMGSNDGVLLSAILPNARVLGVDPATNVGKEAQKRGVPTLQAFFNEKLIQRLFGL